MNPVNDRELRIVTHYDVSHEDCEAALWAMSEFCERSHCATG
jgi:hypothetical protein